MSSSRSENKSGRQVEIQRQTLDQSHAFVSHTSSSLRDSKVLWPSEGSRIHSASQQDEDLVAVTRVLGAAYEGRNAEEVLAGFCQKIFLLYRTDTRALGIASVIAEQLFKSVDDNGCFARETMPLGIQGVQELNWTNQDEELEPLRQEYRRRIKDEGKPLTPFSMTDPNGNELVFAGLEEETLILIDKTMLSAGLVKYRHHTFDIGLGRATCSYQLFVKVNHRDFVRSWFQSSLAPVRDMAVAVMTAMRIFSEARRFINEPGRRTEAVVLVETIRRGQFYTNSNVVDEGTAAARGTLTPSDRNISAEDASAHNISAAGPGTLTPSDRNVSAEDASAHNISTAPNSSSQPNISHSQPAVSSSSTSPAGSSPSDTMCDESTPVPTATVQASSTKNGNKKKNKKRTRPNKKKSQTQTTAQSPTQSLTQSNEVTQASEDRNLSGIVDKMANITLSEPLAHPSSASAPPLPAVQPSGDRPAEGSSTASSTKLTQNGKNGESSKTHTAEELDQDFDDATSQHSSESDRTVTQADFLNKDVAVSSSSGGQQDNRLEEGCSAGAANEKEPTKKEDEELGTTSEAQTTTPTEGGSEDGEHNLPTDQDPQPRPAAFKFDSFDPRLRCLKPDCRNMTSCWDCVVVICPACGTDSFSRYCRKQHLYDDIQRHWAVECGRNKIDGPIDRDTIRPSQLPKRPFIFGRYHDMVERHRQAVYRAMEDSDFFIFNDVEMLDESIVYPTQTQWNSVRGTGEAVLQIVFPDDMTPRSDRQVFNYHIERILSVGKPLAEDSCLAAMEMIRSALVMSGNWTEEVLTYLCMQLTGEWGDFKVPERFYNVNEANAAWQTHHALLMA